MQALQRRRENKCEEKAYRTCRKAPFSQECHTIKNSLLGFFRSSANFRLRKLKIFQSGRIELAN
jgi:hypothetical protein